MTEEQFEEALILREKIKSYEEDLKTLKSFLFGKLKRPNSAPLPQFKVELNLPISHTVFHRAEISLRSIEWVSVFEKEILNFELKIKEMKSQYKFLIGDTSEN